MTTHNTTATIKGGIAAGRVNRVTDKESIAAQITQLGIYSSINYLCEEWNQSFLIVIDLNPDYPEKGKKFSVRFADLIEGQASKDTINVAQSNKPKQIARWLIGRKATLYSRQP